MCIPFKIVVQFMTERLIILQDLLNLVVISLNLTDLDIRAPALTLNYILIWIDLVQS
jgi:hypothetical protein